MINGQSGLGLKVCGMKDVENIREIAALSPDYMGFIFYEKSPRYAGSLAPETVADLNKNILKVGVFVNEIEAKVTNIAQKYQLDYLQLHGSESPEYCANLQAKGFKLIKAFQVDEDFDFKNVEVYKEVVEYYLFDTRSTGWGGSGKQFDQKLLLQYDHHNAYFLSGGIGLEELDNTLNNTQISPAVLDINSKAEINPGYKSKQTVELIKKKIEKHNQQLYESGN